MNTTTWPASSRQGTSAGFSLVEILVALIIGLVSTMAIMQLFALSEGQKRTVTGSADAETNGAFALYSLQRDIRQSGYGVNALNLLGCNVTLRTGITISQMVPITINHASIPPGDASTDTLLVVYGNGNGSTEGNGILPPSSTSPTYTVQTPTSFAVNDRVIAMPQSRASPCDLVLGTVSSVSSTAVNVTNWVTGMTNGTLFDLGLAPQIVAYAIRGGNLTVCDYMTHNCGMALNSNAPADPTAWIPIVSNIVSLRAQYGRDASSPMDGLLDRYDRCVASPSPAASTQCTSPPTATSTQCGWARISSVRIAVVARSGQYEVPKEAQEGNVRQVTHVTPAAPTWSGSLSTSSSAAHPIDLSGITDWQDYRYKTFETVVPIRNILLLGAQAGC